MSRLIYRHFRIVRKIHGIESFLSFSAIISQSLFSENLDKFVKKHFKNFSSNFQCESRLMTREEIRNIKNLQKTKLHCKDCNVTHHLIDQKFFANNQFSIVCKCNSKEVEVIHEDPFVIDDTELGIKCYTYLQEIENNCTN